jgi:DNA-binding MarR family transcriptional regulator
MARSVTRTKMVTGERKNGRKQPHFSVRDYPFFFMHQIIYKNNANIGSALKHRKLTPTVWRILAILQEQNGMHVGALSRESLIERTLLSRILAVLERKKYIRRSPYPGDKRYTAVNLEPAGYTAFNDILPSARREIERAISGLGKPDLDRLQIILEHIIGNLNRATAR